MTSTFDIKPFPIKTASESEYRLANELGNTLRAEILPDDPPIPLAEEIQRMQNIPPFVEVQAWAALIKDETSAIASGTLEVLRDGTNEHLAQFQIQVLPKFRRRGIARALLAHITDTARAENRTLLITGTSDRVPAGEAFMARLGAERGMETHLNQLDLRDLNRELIRTWMADAPTRAAGYDLEFLDGHVPEELLDDFAALFDVMNTAPRDNLQVEDFKMTPEKIRQQEKSLDALGVERWIFVAREKSTGNLVGFTGTSWHPNRPTILQQQGTAVVPEYRGHGLGRWLKAAMLDRVLRVRPSVRFVRTGNADSNAAMLKINFELGFKHYISETIWQVKTEKILEYLGQREVAHV